MKKLIVEIEDEVHAKFKAFCYGRGVTMREALLELIELPTKPRVIDREYGGRFSKLDIRGGPRISVKGKEPSIPGESVLDYGDPNL